MPPIFIKGGIWKNTEDEILKAAVMKYGVNQWARISSLLHRKTAKQCKQRWEEWLDPRIRKTEWSREEEEQLLHLAKLMPTQWRTIAPIIGRTPAQCLGHYEKLLDQAQGIESRDDADDPRRLRPGEIDPNPHTKPARPDPIDMDEDEKEMLSEARARLANTQGRKAKRKARERQLEEAKRVARLQKRRELLAAGIALRERKFRKRGVDYNAEIPFEKKPARGFFDTSVDEKVEPEEFRRKRRQDVEGETYEEQERKRRKEDKLRLKKLEEQNAPAAIMKVNSMRQDQFKRKRSKLVLPEPQVSDQELEQLSKLGQSGVDVSAAGDAPTASLLETYSQTPQAGTSLRTPKAPALKDTLVTEARNILALNQTDSVLSGGENTPLHEGGGSFQGITPQRQQMATPNRVLSTPFRGASVEATPGRSGSSGSATPASQEAGTTPVRDKLGINAEKDSALLTPRTRAEQMRQASLKLELQRGLASLPQPKSDFGMVIPDVEPEEEQAPESDIVPDAADIDAERERREKAEAERQMKRRSQAVQRGLPLPQRVAPLDTSRKAKKEDDLQVADDLIREEMDRMLKFDKGIPVEAFDLLSLEDIEETKQVLQEEMARMEQEFGAADDADELFDSAADDVLYVPGKERFARASLCSNKDLIDSLEREHTLARKHMVDEFKRAAKMEKRLNIGLGGYKKRATSLASELSQTFEDTVKARIDLRCFERLRKEELNAIPTRMEALQEEVEAQDKRQTELQEKYKTLAMELEQLQSQQAQQ